jgi:Fe2+ transport system protein FeoA
MMYTGKCFPLFLLFPGEKAVVCRLDGGRNFRQRLTNMGIRQGVRIEVLRGGRKGPCVVKVEGTTIMIGHGMTNRILVERK